jgi:hypothetical protein
MAVSAARKTTSVPSPSTGLAPAKARAKAPRRANSTLPLQAKLKINEPNDRFEREADAVADRVMQLPESELKQKRADGCSSCGKGRKEEVQTFSLQRQEEEEEAQTFSLQRQEEEEEELQPYSLQRQEEEEEAQTFSLQRQEEEEEELQPFSLQRQEEEEEELQTFSLQRQEEEEEELQPFSLQRQEEEEEAQTASLQRQSEEEEEEEAQAKTNPGGRARVTPRFESRLRGLKAGGRPLDAPVRRFMEGRFGRSFESVRVHTDGAAAALARQANARAFAVGRHLVFGSGQYRPSADQGRRLIAHELTHVLQQRGGLHSVQRELLQPQAETAEPSDERLLIELHRLLGLDDATMPAAIKSIVNELIRTAVAGPEGHLLRALSAADFDAATTKRLIRTSDYEFELSVVRTATSAAVQWTLTRAGEKRPLFGHAGTVADEAEPGVGGADEQTLNLVTPTPPRYAADPAVGVPSSAQVDTRELPREEPARTAEIVAPPSSDALGAADAAPEIDSRETSDAGSGESAGTDAPSLPRPAIDIQAEDDLPEEEQAPELEVSRKAASDAPNQVDAAAESAVTRVVSAHGAPLPAAVRGDMESRFDADLSSVRVHYDGAAATAARSLGAKAFTVGPHVVFGRGYFQLASEPGRELLAHELAHVLQNRSESSPTDLVQRQVEECPPPEPVPEVEVVSSPTGPAEDPAFQQMEQRTGNRAANQAEHGSGEDKSAEANAAAEVREGENRTHAQSEQVGEMATEAASPPAFNKKAFISSVLAEVEKIAPETLDDVVKFSDRGKAGQVKGAVQGEVASASQDTQDPLEDSATADPGPGQSPRNVAPLDVESPGGRPGSIRADRAMPPPRTESEMDLSADTVRADNMLKEACISREFMDEHGDPELAGAASAQDDLHTVTEEGPQQFREGEAAELEGARAGASAQGAQGVAGMFGARTGEFGEVGTNQGRTKTENELKREAAATAINTIFTDTQTKVQGRLTQIDEDVSTTFDRETEAAINKFESFIRRNAEKYKKSWLDSALDFLSDILFDPPPREVRDFYREGRVTFLNDMEIVIGNVADIVDKGLQDARKLVDEGKQKVQEKLDSLGSDLDDFKQQISDQMNDKFRKLEGDINAKQGEIVKSLAQSYVKAFERVKALENQVREEYKNAFDRAREAIGAAVDFVVGWAEKLAAVVGGAATRIIREPLKFLRNVGAGIIQGFTMFMSEIGTNIKGAVVEWITGNLGGGGIQLPQTFDVKGIVGFLLDLVGLGVEGIKLIARKVLGHRAVDLIEKGAEGFEKIKVIFDVLASEGPSGLFKFLASEFAKMKEAVMAGAAKALAEGLVVAGIKRVLGIISGLVSGGVGTVITIVLTIIDVILWLRDNAAQLAEVVGTVASMAMAVLNGQVAALAGAINNVLKRLLPLVLGFVGALVGIGGVVRKIQKIFKAIGKPARRAIKKLFLKFKKMIKKLLKKLGRKKKAKNKAKLRDGQIGETIPFSSAGKSHTLKIDQRTGVATVASASPGPVTRVVTAAEKDNRFKAAAKRAKSLNTRINNKSKKILRLLRDKAKLPAAEREDKEVEKNLKRLKTQLIVLMSKEAGASDDSATPSRFSRARSFKDFNGPKGFTAAMWKARFTSIEEAQTQKDLQFGRRNNIIERKGGRNIFTSEVSEADVIRLGMQEVNSKSRGSTKFKKRFSKADLTAWLQGRKIDGLPQDPGIFTPARVQTILERLIASGGVFDEIAGAPGSYTLAGIPPMRELPGGFDIRSRYYINGSGFSAQSKAVWNDGRSKIGKAIKFAALGQLSKWNQLVTLKIRPSGDHDNFVAGNKAIYLKRGEYDVDHSLPLAKHWQQKRGWDSKMGVRHRIAGDSGNLALMHFSENRKKQAEGATYNPKSVGPNFTGPGKHPHEAVPGVLFQNWR